jgi:propanol-preferring alcohol dehydrogenase
LAVHHHQRALVLADIAEPEPGPGEVVLDIKAAGLCHSDVGAMTDPCVCPTASASAPGYGRDGGFTFKRRAGGAERGLSD